MDTYLKQVVDYLLSQSWQIAILTVVVACITFLLRHKSAHIRYLLWLIVLMKCLVPPLYAIPLRVLPRGVRTVPVSVPKAEEAGSDSLTTAVAAYDAPVSGGTATLVEDMSVSELDTSNLSPGGSKILSSPAQGHEEGTETETGQARKLTWADARFWTGFVWLAGICAYLAVNSFKALSTRRWLRRERQPLEPNLQVKIAEFFSARGFMRLPKIWVINDVDQPFVWGLLRGNIYLPDDLLGTGNLEQQKNVLGHELSHVVRFDAGLSLLQVIAQAIFWFHPFVWWANLWIRREREKCCDEMAVAGLNVRPKDYSRAIVDALTSDHRSSRRVPSLAIAGPANSLEKRIRDVLRPGRRFCKGPGILAASAVLAIAAVTVPAGLARQYRARGKIRIRPVLLAQEFQTRDTLPVPFYESFLNAQMAFMKSPDFLSRVLKRPDVWQTDWYSETRKSLKERLGHEADARMQRLKDALSVRRRPDTEIVNVSFSCTDAGDAAVIVNAVLEQYVAYVGNVSRVQSILLQQKEHSESVISEREGICAKLREELGTADPEELIAAARAHLDEIAARLRRVEESIAALKLQINDPNGDASNDLKADTPGSVESVPDRYMADPEWKELTGRLRTLRSQIAESRLSSKHPQSVRTQKDLEFARESLRLRERQLDQKWRDQNAHDIDPLATTPDAGADDSEEEALSPERRLALAKEEEKLLRTELMRCWQEHDRCSTAATSLEMQSIILRREHEFLDAIRQRLDEWRIKHRVTAEVSILLRASVPNEVRPWYLKNNAEGLNGAHPIESVAEF